jgi:hypothetical protein
MAHANTLGSVKIDNCANVSHYSRARAFFVVSGNSGNLVSGEGVGFYDPI